VLARAVQQAFVLPLLRDVADAALLALAEPSEPPTSWPCTSVRLWAPSSTTDASRFRKPALDLLSPSHVSLFEDAAPSWLGFEVCAHQVTSLSLCTRHSVERSVALGEPLRSQMPERYELLFDQLSFVAFSWLELQFLRLRQALKSSADVEQGLRHRLVALSAESQLLGLCFTPAHQRAYSARLRASSAASLVKAVALLAAEMGLMGRLSNDRVAAIAEQARVGLHYLEPFVEEALEG